MDLFKLAEHSMSMDDATWMRHANPLSVWTRFTCLPLIILAIWSRVWLGWWSLIPLGLALAWTWVNPRVFPAPDRTDSWASLGTFGERVFLNRKTVPIPAHHERWAMILTGLSMVGIFPLVWGLWALCSWCSPRSGLSTAWCGFYHDMKDAHPDYAGWMRTGS